MLASERSDLETRLARWREFNRNFTCFDPREPRNTSASGPSLASGSKCGQQFGSNLKTWPIMLGIHFLDILQVFKSKVFSVGLFCQKWPIFDRFDSSTLLWTFLPAAKMQSFQLTVGYSTARSANVTSWIPGKFFRVLSASRSVSREVNSRVRALARSLSL